MRIHNLTDTCKKNLLTNWKKTAMAQLAMLERNETELEEQLNWRNGRRGWTGDIGAVRMASRTNSNWTCGFLQVE